MTVILLIRHGQNDMVGKRLAGRLPDVHLNDDGKEQAERLAEALVELPIKAVFSSPLERASETAAPIAKAHCLSVEIVPELLEINFGAWQGKTLKQLQRRKLWKKVQDEPASVRFPEGESFAEAQTRVAQGLIAVSERFDGKDMVVCVSHSDIIRLAVAHFLGMPLDHFQRLRIDTASVSVLFLDGSKAYFAQVNNTFELPRFGD